MDIRQLRAFLAIAETGSVTRAAELLHVVQPAVTRQLKLLEDDVGIALFERGRNGMVLTDGGRLLVERAGRALRELDSARLELRPPAGLIVGIVNVGLLPSSCELLAAPLAMAIRTRYPGIKISMTVGLTDHLTRWLETGEVDAALLYNPNASPGLNTKPLLREPLWLCGPPSEGLQADVPVGIDALGKCPLILPSKSHGLRTLVEHACSVADVKIDIAVETNALALHKGLVVRGLGLGVMPRVAIRAEIEGGSLCAAPIAHPAFIRTIALASSTTRRTTTAVQCVTTELEQHAKTAVTSGAWQGAEWIGE